MTGPSEEHPVPVPDPDSFVVYVGHTPMISTADSSYSDGPNFYSAEEVERFIEELRAASARVFGPVSPDADIRSVSSWSPCSGNW